MHAIGKITVRGQTTIPQEVRNALYLEPGDHVAWEINADGSAIVRRVRTIDAEYMHAVEGTLCEWLSDTDEESYRDL